MKPEILMITTDEAFSDQLTHLVRDWDVQVTTATSLECAEQLLEQRSVALIMVEIELEGDENEGRSGLDFVRTVAPGIPKIVITKHATVETARQVYSAREATLDLFQKDESIETLLGHIKRVLPVRKPRLNAGLVDFARIIEDGFFYIDKSMLIKEVWETGASVILIPRPRRFGKTLMIEMLKAFFEKSERSRRGLFTDLAIQSEPEIMAHQGRFPVIHLTFKDVKAASFQACLEALKHQIANEFARHGDISKTLAEHERADYEAIIDRTADESTYAFSLQRLSRYLYRHHGTRVIALIDEYDMPLHSAEEHGYTDQLMPFVRNLLSALLKDNDAVLEKGILTGILRIAKESIFSGLKNLRVVSLLNKRFADKLGLTQGEVDHALAIYGLGQHRNRVREWYNGYRIGGHELHNPWSIIGFLESGEFGPYWINTSDNKLIRDHLLDQSGSDLEAEIAELLAGGTVPCHLRENLTLRELSRDRDVLWIFLFFFFFNDTATTETESGDHLLCIPNREVRSFFKEMFSLNTRVPAARAYLEDIRAALRANELETFEKRLQELTVRVLSFHDLAGNAEGTYHGFLIGLLLSLEDDYAITSNREAGFGRYDIAMCPHNQGLPGLILEVKRAQKGKRGSLDAALSQIRERDYARDLIDRGIDPIYAVAILFEGKRVQIKAQSLT